MSGPFFLTHSATLLVFAGIWAMVKGITDIEPPSRSVRWVRADRRRGPRSPARIGNVCPASVKLVRGGPRSGWVQDGGFGLCSPYAGGDGGGGHDDRAGRRLAQYGLNQSQRTGVTSPQKLARQSRTRWRCFGAGGTAQRRARHTVRRRRAAGPVNTRAECRSRRSPGPSAVDEGEARCRAAWPDALPAPRPCRRANSRAVRSWPVPSTLPSGENAAPDTAATSRSAPADSGSGSRRCRSRCRRPRA